MSSERYPRPCFEWFQKLMERNDTMSIAWWAETLAACRDALIESRAARFEFKIHGAEKSADEIAEMARQEEALDRHAVESLQKRNLAGA